MFIYQKKLQYPVKISRPNPALAKFIISQYGGPDGERFAAVSQPALQHAVSGAQRPLDRYW